MRTRKYTYYRPLLVYSAVEDIVTEDCILPLALRHGGQYPRLPRLVLPL